MMEKNPKKSERTVQDQKLSCPDDRALEEFMDCESEEAVFIQKHLNSCASCRRRLEHFKIIDSMVREVESVGGSCKFSECDPC